MNTNAGALLADCRKEIERQRDKCRTDIDAAPFDQFLACIDVALRQAASQGSAGAIIEQCAAVCETYFRTYEHQNPMMRAQYEAFGKLFAKTIRALSPPVKTDD